MQLKTNVEDKETGDGADKHFSFQVRLGVSSVFLYIRQGCPRLRCTCKHSDLFPVTEADIRI